MGRSKWFLELSCSVQREQRDSSLWNNNKAYLPYRHAQNDFLLPYERLTWSIACPGSCETCRNMQQGASFYQVTGCCNDFLCKYVEKPINPERAITRYIIKGTTHSLMQHTIISCQNHIACPLSQSFDWKLTRKNPFCHCLPKRKSL